MGLLNILQNGEALLGLLCLQRSPGGGGLPDRGGQGRRRGAPREGAYRVLPGKVAVWVERLEQVKSFS